MFDQLLAKFIDPKSIQSLKDGVKFAVLKANEASENSKEQTRLLSDILQELKSLNYSAKKGG